MRNTVVPRRTAAITARGGSRSGQPERSMVTFPAPERAPAWVTTTRSPWKEPVSIPRMRTVLPRVWAAYQKPAWDQSASTATSKG